MQQPPHAELNDDEHVSALRIVGTNQDFVEPRVTRGEEDERGDDRDRQGAGDSRPPSGVTGTCEVPYHDEGDVQQRDEGCRQEVRLRRQEEEVQREQRASRDGPHARNSSLIP